MKKNWKEYLFLYLFLEDLENKRSNYIDPFIHTGLHTNIACVDEWFLFVTKIRNFLKRKN